MKDIEIKFSGGTEKVREVLATKIRGMAKRPQHKLLLFLANLIQYNIMNYFNPCGGNIHEKRSFLPTASLADLYWIWETQI